MKKLFSPASALLATLLITAVATAAPLDAFKGQKGALDIAGGTAHIPVMKEAAKRIMTTNPRHPHQRCGRWFGRRRSAGGRRTRPDREYRTGVEGYRNNQIWPEDLPVRH